MKSCNRFVFHISAIENNDDDENLETFDDSTEFFQGFEA